MKAGYLVAKWVKKKIDSMGQDAAISAIASVVGYASAAFLVRKVVTLGVTAAATSIATWLGTSGTIAGPLGTIVGMATGYF